MRKFIAILLLAALSSCTPERKPSYAGMWRYVCSEPDLGPQYKESWVEVDRKWNYFIHDGGTGLDYSGGMTDFSLSGMKVTLSVGEGGSGGVFVSEVLYLKDGFMKVRTDSVNGILTEIHFRRED